MIPIKEERKMTKKTLTDAFEVKQTTVDTKNIKDYDIFPIKAFLIN